MKTISIDAVTAALLTTGHLSFITTDHPPPPAECNCWQPMTARALNQHSVGCALFGPSPWIGQRVALHAAAGGGFGGANEAILLLSDTIVSDAIVGSGTLAEALPIYDGDDYAEPGIIVRNGHLFLARTYVGWDWTDISDLLPLQDWSPGRWALGFTDVAPTSERCPNCGGLAFGVDQWGEPDPCPMCGGHAACPPVEAPVLSGDDPTYKEWRT